MKIASAPLEDWLRDYYFTCEIDISCSGVQNFTLGELRGLIGLSQNELDRVGFNDSPSCGNLSLRKAISERWGNGDPAFAMATHGSSEVMFLIMTALLKPHDEVVILDPCYHSLGNLPRAVGCELKTWPLRFERRFVPDVAECKRLIDPKTRMVVVNFPHNPTGTTLNREQQTDLVSAVAEAGAYLVWDGALAELTYDQPPLPNPGLTYDRTITIGTLSKGYGLPGLRVGWCLARPDLLTELVRLRDYTTLYLSPLVELIAERAIRAGDNLLRIRLEQARQNLRLLDDWVEQNHDYVEWVRPKGGVTAFLRLCDVPDVDAFCHRLVQSDGVLLVPGSCFNRPQHVRLGFGGPASELKEGLARLSTRLHARFT
jgi:capreomycidine synthase